MSESSIPLQFNNWWHESWASRRVAEPRLAAYACGRGVNCFEFHAQQAFVLSVTSVKSDRWEPHGSAAQAALRKLADLIACLKLTGDAEQSPEEQSRWMEERLERLHDDWRNDPVGETDTVRADNYLHDPEDPFPDCMSAWREFLETTGQIRLDQEWRDLCAHVPVDCLNAMGLGRCLDSIIRPSAVFLAQLRQDAPTGIPVAGESDFMGHANTKLSVPASKGSFVRSFVAGEVEPDGGWQTTLHHALNDAQISVPPTLQRNHIGPGVHDRLEYVKRLDAFIWAQFDSSLPRWDETLRRLVYQGEEIKNFSKEAESNEAKRVTQLDIIRQFHELGWPSEIDTRCFGFSGDDPTDYFKSVESLNSVRTRGNARRLPISFRLINSGRAIKWGPFSPGSEYK